jgi:hypothetical protein
MLHSESSAGSLHEHKAILDTNIYLPCAGDLQAILPTLRSALSFRDQWDVLFVELGNDAVGYVERLCVKYGA